MIRSFVEPRNYHTELLLITQLTNANDGYLALGVGLLHFFQISHFICTTVSFMK